MDFNALSVGIVIMTYCIAEVVKQCFLKDDKKRSMLPLICIIIGAGMALLIMKCYPAGLPSCDNYVDAIGLGGMSGAASTGCNQLYRQFTKFSTGASDKDVGNDGENN